MRLLTPKLISNDKKTFFKILGIHDERNLYYLKLAMPFKDTDTKAYSMKIKAIKDVNKEVFESAFFFLTRHIDNLGLQDLIKVLEALSSTRYHDKDKMALVESIAERVILVLLKIDDESVKHRMLGDIKTYCKNLDLSDFYDE